MLPSSEEPPSPELQVELNERGVPLLTSLPEILEALARTLTLTLTRTRTRTPTLTPTLR